MKVPTWAGLLLIAGIFVAFSSPAIVGSFKDSRAQAKATVEAAKPKVEVTFTSDPEGALVTVGNSAKGRTPVIVPVLANEAVSYSVVAEEPFEDYTLYKPFGGTLNVSETGGVSVWLERTSAEEQAAQQQAAEEVRQAEAQRQREAEAAREAELEARKVYYRLESNCRYGVDVTMSNADGNTSQYSNRTNDFSYWFIPRAGQFLYLSAQNQCDYGYVTVKFVKNGVVLQENTSQGGYVIATVKGQW